MNGRAGALVIAAAFLGMLGLVAAQGHALNDEQARRVRAENRRDGLERAFERECTFNPDGAVTCPPGSVRVFGILMSHPLPATTTSTVAP